MTLELLDQPADTTDTAPPARIRDLGQEPVLNLRAIQGDLLLGHRKLAEAHVFFRITDRSALAGFIRSLPITRARDVYRERGAELAMMTGTKPPAARHSLAFAAKGLERVGLVPDSGKWPAEFGEGLARRAGPVLNDPAPETWIIGAEEDGIDGVFITTWEEPLDNAAAEEAARAIFGAEGSGIEIIEPILTGNVRPGENAGHEHFGFLDGVSQPGLRGCVDADRTRPLTPSSKDNPDQGNPGQDLLWPGEFILGYEAQPMAGDDITLPGQVRELPALWMKDGAFLVIRRLTQKVPEMHAAAAAAAAAAGIDADLLKAQLVGRWPSGAPIVKTPTADDPDLGKAEDRNNDFEFGDDKAGVLCPWAAHIRKVYARDDAPGDIDAGDEEREEAEVRTQTHRMLRRGIQFGPEVTQEENEAIRTAWDRGLLFRCYVVNIGRQFEEVQAARANSARFAHRGTGQDPIIGQSPAEGPRIVAGAGAVGEKPSFSFAPWVTMTGGGYFFAPSVDVLEALDAGETRA